METKKKFSKKALYKNKGITLLALVITIVILIILATIAINMIFGDNGLINRTEQAKLEQSKAEVKEKLELVLADAYAEKYVTQEYTEEEFLYEHLDNFVYEQEPGAKIFEYGEKELISLNGHAFYLDRSVPKLGDYLGEEGILPPVITRINILDKTTSSVNIEVLTTKSDGLKYKYAIKELGQGDENYTQETEKSDNTNEFTGLQENTVYTVKVELIKDGEIQDTKTINIVIGKMEKGVVRFENIVWKNGQASVKILTDETDYTLQYQIGGINGEWINTTSGSVISGLKLKDNVYGRLWSEYGESDPANVTIEDKIAPIVTVTSNGTNTNSVSVKVQAVDNESGMADSVTYKYFVKESSQPDTSYVQKGTNTTGNYTITGLTQGTSYDVKVEVTGDKAGNIGIGYLQNQTTGELPGGEEGVEQGAITFGKTTWTSGQASITINTNTELQLQYQKNSTSGSWINIENGETVIGLKNNDTIYARLTDGTNYGEYASATIVDDIAPTITSIDTLTSTHSIMIKLEVEDKESGVLKIEYSIDDGLNYSTGSTNTDTQFEFTNLTENTIYKIKIRITDYVGNSLIKELENSTKQNNNFFIQEKEFIVNTTYNYWSVYPTDSNTIFVKATNVPQWTGNCSVYARSLNKFNFSDINEIVLNLKDINGMYGDIEFGISNEEEAPSDGNINWIKHVSMSPNYNWGVMDSERLVIDTSDINDEYYIWIRTWTSAGSAEAEITSIDFK